MKFIKLVLRVIIVVVICLAFASPVYLETVAQQAEEVVVRSLHALWIIFRTPICVYVGIQLLLSFSKRS